MSKLEEEDEQFTSPSFNSYSRDKLAEIASKVVASSSSEEDDDFEFDVSGEFNGQIFPVFNNNDESSTQQMGVPLSTLLRQEISTLHINKKSNTDSLDEFENIPRRTCCVWARQKSRSTGSSSAISFSKRWASMSGFLLKRNSSEGMKDNLVVFNNANNNMESSDHKAGKGTTVITVQRSSSHEEFYVRNRALKEGDKKKSFLPYRKDLVGFFVNVNVLLGKTPLLPEYGHGS